jgi:hypothetical protein
MIVNLDMLSLQFPLDVIFDRLKSCGTKKKTAYRDDDAAISVPGTRAGRSVLARTRPLHLILQVSSYSARRHIQHISIQLLSMIR